MSELTTTITSDMAAAFMEDPTATLASGIAMEHISLDGDDPVEQRSANKPRVAQQRLSFDNHVHGRRTEITLYDDGTLLAQVIGRGKPGKSRLVKLKYLDPVPLTLRRVATRSMQAAVGLMGLGMFSGALAYFSVLPHITLPVSATFIAAALIAAGLFVYRTRERTAFVTRHGRVEVLGLVASVGCLGACHRLVPVIREAISKAQSLNPPDRSTYLRREMQEHYRLREAGHISSEACKVGTRRILNRFD